MRAPFPFVFSCVLRSMKHRAPSESVPHPDPPELSRRIARGELEVIGDIYRRYERPLLAFLRSRGQSRADAEDALHEVFLKAWKERRGVLLARSPAAWLHRVARNVVIDRARTERRRQVQQRAIAERHRDDGRGRNSSDPSLLVESAETRRRVVAAIHDLPDHLRSVVVLRKLSGLTNDEAAEVLDLEPGTVASRLWAALRRIERALAEVPGSSSCSGEVRP